MIVPLYSYPISGHFRKIFEKNIATKPRYSSEKMATNTRKNIEPLEPPANHGLVVEFSTNAADH